MADLDQLPVALEHLEAAPTELPTIWLYGNWFLLEMLQRSPDPEGTWTTLTEQRSTERLRTIMVAIGYGDYAAQGDGLWVSRWLERGEFDRASAYLVECLPAYADERGPRLWLQVMRADCLRMQERWQASMNILDHVDQAFEAQPADPTSALELEAAAMVLGVRVQLEMMLGRLGRARELAALETVAADRYLAAFPPESGSPRALETKRSAWIRACDLELMSDRNLALIDQLTGFEMPGTETLRLHYLGKAYTSLAVVDPGAIEPARSYLERSLAASADGRTTGAGELVPYVQAFVFASLAHLAELEGDVAALDAALADMDAVLAGMEGAEEPTRPRALRAALQCRRNAVVGAAGVAMDQRLAAYLALVDCTRELISLRQEAPQVAGGLGDLQDVVRRYVLGTLFETAERLERLPEAFGLVMEMQAVGGQARALGASPGAFSLARIQSALVGDGGLVMWIPAPQSSVLVVLDRQGLALHRLGSGLELRLAVARLDRELQHAAFARTERVRAAALAVRDALLPADVLAALASWDHTYFVGAESVGHPALEVLPLGAGGEFGTELAMGYLPSVPLGVLLAEGVPAPDAGGRLAVLAGPPDGTGRDGAGLASLAFEPAVWRDFAGPFSGDRLVLRSGPEANREVLSAEDWSAAGALNLFCHGVFDPARLLPAGLAIAGEGTSTVWWEDIAALRLPPLVVLSACGAARGPARLGEDGIAHLGGAFLSAGAKAVLISRGDLEVRSTLEFNRRFHSALHAGATPLVALRDARRALLTADEPAPRLSQLVLLGAGHTPRFVAAPQARWPRFVFGGLGLAAVAALALLGKRR